MTSTNSWAWYPGTQWPGFTQTNQDNLGTNGNGKQITPGSATGIIWNDANNDDMISDTDTDDAQLNSGDTVTVGGANKTVLELAKYTNSTLTARGVTYTVETAVWLFDDGTYMVRVRDPDIPDGHFKKVTELRLGTFDGVEYDGSYISTRVNGFVCFATGTVIDTPTGPRPVHRLRKGDLVLTRDAGPQPIIWRGQMRCIATGPAAPIAFAPGALGAQTVLRVSPQHRMLVTGWQAELMFGLPEILAPALALVNDHSIRRQPRRRLTYFHLMLPTPQLICASGVWSESFVPGPVALSVLSNSRPPPQGTSPGESLPYLRPWEGRLLGPAVADLEPPGVPEATLPDTPARPQ